MKFFLYIFVVSSLVLSLNSTVDAQNVSILKHNKVTFTGGTNIADTVPEGIAVDEIPLDIDYPAYQQYIYAQDSPTVGTININVGASRHFITGQWRGQVLTPAANHFQGIRGLDVGIKTGTAGGDPNAWSHIQVGTSNYGTSIWMRLHEDEEAMEISGYNNIQRDSLEPVNPLRLGLQVKGSGNGDVNIADTLYINDGNVGIHTNYPDEALTVSGNVSLTTHKLFGKIGEVRSATASNGGTLPVTGATVTLATFTFSGADQFGADLKGFVSASIIHILPDLQGSSVSWMDVKTTGGAVVAKSVPMRFDFQDGFNERNTYNHFALMEIEANTTYVVRIYGKLANSPTGGTRNTQTGQQFINKRVIIYGIPAAGVGLQAHP